MRLLGKLAIAVSAVWVSTTAFALTDPQVARPAAEPAPVTLGAAASADARYMARWVREQRDDHGLPYAIVDKKAAHIYVFAAGGKLVGESSTLLGLTRGDVAVPGAGQKDPSRLTPNERRTPAGRFESKPGNNIHGEGVVWVDYETGIAIHRVRPGRAQAERNRSLATAGGGDDKRQSLGCVVVPEAFFYGTVLPTLGHSHGVVYVLPEESAVQAMFKDPASTTTVAALQKPAASPVKALVSSVVTPVLATVVAAPALGTH